MTLTFEPPPGLPTRALAHWMRLAEILESQGVLAESDVDGLTAAVWSYEIAMQAAEKITGEGVMVPDERGSVKKSPSWQIMREGFEAYRAWAVQLGLTPAARSRMKISDPETDPAGLLD